MQIQPGDIARGPDGLQHEVTGVFRHKDPTKTMVTTFSQPVDAPEGVATYPKSGSGNTFLPAGHSWYGTMSDYLKYFDRGELC